jgi:hypothetical protein
MTYQTDSKRARRVIPAIAGAILLATAALAPACKGVVATTIEPPVPPSVGNIGDPCTPSDERHAEASGAQVGELGLEDGFTGCNSGICLVNHFQGRVSCPPRAGGAGALRRPERSQLRQRGLVRGDRVYGSLLRLDSTRRRRAAVRERGVQPPAEHLPVHQRHGVSR